MYVIHHKSTKAAALRMYKRGATLRDIAEVTGVSAFSVRRWRDEAGIPARTPGGPRRYSEATRRRAMRMLERGASAAAISDRLGMAEATVSWWARTLRIKRSKPIDRSRHSAVVRRRAVDLYVAGKSARYVADVLGDRIDWHTVIRWVRAAGLPVRESNSVPKIDHAQAAALHLELRSITKVAKVMGCSKTGVVKALDRHRRARIREQLHAST